MSELKVTSKKYNDKDVLEVDNLGEAVNEEIEAGKIPASGTKLYQHFIHVGIEEMYIISTKANPYIFNGLHMEMGKQGVLLIRDSSNNTALVDSLYIEEGKLRLAYVDTSIQPVIYENSNYSDTVTEL